MVYNLCKALTTRDNELLKSQTTRAYMYMILFDCRATVLATVVEAVPHVTWHGL